MKARPVTYLISLLFFLLIFNTGCKKDSYSRELRGKYNDALNGVTFSCTESPSVLYFSADFKGKKICYHDGLDGYHASFRNALGVVTSDPSLEVGGEGTDAIFEIKYIDFGLFSATEMSKENFGVETPKFISDISHKEIAEKFFTLGTLPLSQNHTLKFDSYLDSTGFNIYMTLPYQERLDAFTLFMVESRLGDQSDSKLEIVSLNKFHQNGKDYYDMELEFECNLYHHSDLKANTFYGRLENGKMRILIEE
jgi:hypothetical protein